MILNDQEKTLILELARNPVFTGLLSKAEAFARTPRYKSGGDEDEMSKVNRLINKSGFADGIDYMVKLLRYDNE